MLIPPVFELEMWKMSQFMTLTDGDKCLSERYEFLMNKAMIFSVKLCNSNSKIEWISGFMEMLLHHLECTLTAINTVEWPCLSPGDIRGCLNSF